MKIGALIIILLLTASTTFSQEKGKSGDDYSEKSTDELAKDLANPNTPLSSFKFRNQFRFYEGSIPESNSQFGFTTLVQPTLPFRFENENTLWVRPGVPLIWTQPYYSENKFESDFGLGDIVIDFQYGGTIKKSILWSVGATLTMPTSTINEFGVNQWAIGPGFQVGSISKKAVIGGFINHQFGLSTESEKVSLTTAQLFLVFLPTGGWNIGSAPLLTYEHNSEILNIPLNLAFGRTVKWRNRPWKFAVEVNYYIKSNETFGQKWMIGINIIPVVKNKLANWFK
jgi:hypothetical protein